MSDPDYTELCNTALSSPEYFSEYLPTDMAPENLLDKCCRQQCLSQCAYELRAAAKNAPVIETCRDMCDQVDHKSGKCQATTYTYKEDWTDGKYGTFERFLPGSRDNPFPHFDDKEVSLLTNPCPAVCCESLSRAFSGGTFGGEKFSMHACLDGDTKAIPPNVFVRCSTSQYKGGECACTSLFSALEQGGSFDCREGATKSKKLYTLNDNSEWTFTPPL